MDERYPYLKCIYVAGVAVGSRWQAYVAHINLGCYYVIGLPLGWLMGWAFHLVVMVLPFYSLYACPVLFLFQAINEAYQSER